MSFNALDFAANPEEHLGALSYAKKAELLKLAEDHDVVVPAGAVKKEILGLVLTKLVDKGYISEEEAKKVWPLALEKAPQPTAETLKLMIELEGAKAEAEIAKERASLEKAEAEIAKERASLEIMKERERMKIEIEKVQLESLRQAEQIPLNNLEIEKEIDNKKKLELERQLYEDDWGDKQQLVVPELHRKALLEIAHSVDIHLRITKTYQRLAEDFYCCRRRCYEKFKEEDQRMLYQDYRNATPEEQNQILCGLIIEENKKSQRLRGSEGESRRRFSRHHSLKEAIPEKELCQKMFLSTIGITLKRARIVSEKMPQSESVTVTPDGRGKHGKQKKISPKSVEMIKKHINQFPAWKSHYARADSERKYLNPDLTIAQMYRLYQKYCLENNLPTDKESMYRKFFNEEFNLSFHHPSQDTCEKCDTFEASLMTANEDGKNCIDFPSLPKPQGNETQGIEQTIEKERQESISEDRPNSNDVQDIESTVVENGNDEQLIPAERKDIELADSEEIQICEERDSKNDEAVICTDEKVNSIPSWGVPEMVIIHETTLNESNTITTIADVHHDDRKLDLDFGREIDQEGKRDGGGQTEADCIEDRSMETDGNNECERENGKWKIQMENDVKMRISKQKIGTQKSSRSEDNSDEENWKKLRDQKRKKVEHN
ncbi:calponin homology domain-containing protein DDB_G0272472-like [Palaemon carinicauda]|uniref:calponin homology domain-containing protein DDB_G0272472-like n=1 Tax=Palaemon carinicauda TaxID=392227 RepID=UPI0035B64E1C